MVEIDAALETLTGFSPALRRYVPLDDDPTKTLIMARTLVDGGRVDPPGMDDRCDVGQVKAGIRKARRSALIATAIAEQVTGDPDVTFGFMTACAEQWISVAFDTALQDVSRAVQIPACKISGECPWTVLGLGKLGARELNPSSDVDIFLVYDSDGPLSGSKVLSAHDLFERVSREAAKILSDSTAHGFCLRVDFDLRPEGRSGALANSMDALVAYYEQYGSPLDRMALTRARPVAGDKAFGRRLCDAISPFIYPRSLVSGALSAIAGVLGRLRGAGGAWSPVFNLKTGRGGIRDVELLVAANQLVHGGRFEDLRQTGTLGLVKAMAGRGLLSAGDADALSTAYRFLRRLEHLVQYRDDRQTQDFPIEGALLDEIARMVDAGVSAGSLLGILSRHRETVAVPADRLFGLSPEAGERCGDRVGTLLDESMPEAARETAASELGFIDAQAALSCVSRLRSAPSSPLHPGNESGYPGLDRGLIEACAASVDPDRGIKFLAHMTGSDKNRRLFEIYRDDRNTLDAMVNVAASSTVVADSMTTDARLALEEAITGVSGGVPDGNDLKEEIEALIRVGGMAEVGDRLSAFKRRHVAGVAISDITGKADVEVVGGGLSDIADACIDGALKTACGGNTKGIVVFGLGTLGGREMGYLSDLDLVFVHDGGTGPLLDAVQKALAILTARGVAGDMYSLDLRLRPSGSQGPLLVEAPAMERFYGEEASGPELLGAINLRAVAGDLLMGQSLACRVRSSAAARLLAEGVFDDLYRTRALQRRGVEKTPERAYHPKLTPGGMIDIETAAHLWGSKGAAETKDMPTGTLANLGLLIRRGGPHKPDFVALDRVYRFLLRLSNRAHLVLDREVARASVDGPAADLLARSLGFGSDGRPAEEMWNDYRFALDDGRKACERLTADLSRVRNRHEETRDD